MAVAQEQENIAEIELSRAKVTEAEADVPKAIAESIQSGKLSIMESVALLQTANVLLTNDSAPLHMAASGDAWIGFVATCKHPDMITHWRNGQWSWRMKNHGKGGIWDVLDHCPNKAETLEAENVGAELLTSWLPDPVAFANWALDKSKESDHG